LDWCEHAKSVGRDQCSNTLLLMAWHAFDRPLRGGRGMTRGHSTVH
jgi:hypothetical protein